MWPLHLFREGGEGGQAGGQKPFSWCGAAMPTGQSKASFTSLLKCPPAVAHQSQAKETPPHPRGFLLWRALL